MHHKTSKNLKDAFAGESQANRKYLAFAKQAEKDGFGNIAKLFRAVAEAETIHAHAHLRVLGEVKGTAENIEEAIAGEGFEFTEMYPQFLNDAREENNKAAEKSFNYANEVEKIHHGLYMKALESVKAGEDIESENIYVCPVCGFTAEDEAPEKCPVCGVSGGSFISIS